MEVVFFDAAGTLFSVRGSVGEIYSRVAAKYGISAEPRELEAQFSRVFRARSREGPPAGGNSGLTAERSWWMEIVRLVFAGKLDSGLLQAYFDEVYEAFRSGHSWELYADTLPCLEHLHTSGYRLAVVSNFDSRLYDLLANLGIDRFFERVVLSWHAGSAKPDPVIFRRALEAMSIGPRQALHVGDSLHEDVAGACAAGLTAVLLDRGGRHPDYKSGIRMENLLGLYDFLIEDHS